MSLYHQKELTPVLYNISGLKTHEWHSMPANHLLFNLHWHDRMELLLITEGSMHYRLKSHEATLLPGQLAIIPPGQLHYGMSGENGIAFRHIMFDVNNFYTQLPLTDLFLKPLAEQKVTFSTWTDHPEILSLFSDIYEHSQSNDNLNALTNMGKIYELISLLYRHCLADKELETDTNQLQHVLDYIHKHYSEKISSASLSKQFGYSESYFCRHFKAVTGMNPMIYIRIIRLDKARKLLLEGQYSLGEIAERSGFSNANYFTSCFRTHFHMTPTEYVKHHKL